MNTSTPTFRAFKQFRAEGYETADAWRMARLCAGKRLYMAPLKGSWTIFRNGEPMVSSLDGSTLLGTMLKADESQV